MVLRVEGRDVSIYSCSLRESQNLIGLGSVKKRIQ